MTAMEKNNASKIVVVTGATSGIGLAVAEILIDGGISVIGIGRLPQRCRETEARLAGRNPAASVRYLTADLSLQRDIRAVAEQIRASLLESGRTGLDGLLNNAGAFSFWLEYTPEGIERQWALHCLAPFLLTHELLPELQAAPSARAVTVGSGSHYGARMHWDDLMMRRAYNGLAMYGQTKLAVVLLALELNRRLGPQSAVRALVADPGLVKTDIGRKGTPAFVGWVWNLRRSGGIPPEESARGIVRLFTDPSVSDTDGIYWKHGSPIAPDPRALDPESAARLWSVAERMCGLEPNSSGE
jgi:NAD(P)-dependent dehydrogenase (short-subunit alcohol dehydrogenase family)